MKRSDEAYGRLLQNFEGVITQAHWIELLGMVRRFVNSSVASGKFQAITRLMPVYYYRRRSRIKAEIWGTTMNSFSPSCVRVKLHIRTSDLLFYSSHAELTSAYSLGYKIRLHTFIHEAQVNVQFLEPQAPCLLLQSLEVQLKPS